MRLLIILVFVAILSVPSWGQDAARRLEAEVAEQVRFARELRGAGEAGDAVATLSAAYRKVGEATDVPEEVRNRLRRTLSAEMSSSPAPVARRTGAYVDAQVLRIKDELVEFAAGSSEGVRIGAVLPIRRPPVSTFHAEVQVTLVDAHQAVGKAPRGLVKAGDVVVVQRTLPIGTATAPSDLASLPAEITFARASAGNRTTYHGRIVEVEQAGPIDISVVSLNLLVGTMMRTARYPVSAIRQLRVNGVLFINDPVKGTLVPADVLPIREAMRAEEQRLERLQLAQIQSEERIRIAEAQAQIESAERERTYLAKLKAEYQAAFEQSERESRERIRIAELAAQQADSEARRAASEAQRAASEAQRAQSAPLPSGSTTTFVPPGPSDPFFPQRGTGGPAAPSSDVDNFLRVAKGITGLYSVFRGIRTAQEGYDSGNNLQTADGLMGALSSGVNLIEAIRGK
jgi:hypothetical protein